MSKPATPAEFDPARFPRKLNLGCGGDIRSGYLNVDMNAWGGPDLVADIRKLDFLPSQGYEEIVAQDVLEHLPRSDTLRVLMQWNRPLRPGGRLVLRLPSVLGVADLLRQPAHQTPEMHEELMQALFGSQAYTGDFHYTSFTEVLLRHYLAEAGFRVTSLTLALGWLFDVVAEKVAHLEECPLPDFSDLESIAGDEAFVDACYRRILRREPDPGGRDYYLNGLKSGMTRGVTISAILAGPEYRELLRNDAARKSR